MLKFIATKNNFIVDEKMFIGYKTHMDHKTFIAAFGGKHYFAGKLGLSPTAVLQWQQCGLPKKYSRRLSLIAAVELFEPMDPRLKSLALDFVRNPDN